MSIDRQKIAEMMDAYASCFADFDERAILSFWHCPCLISVGDNQTIFEDETQFSANLKSLVGFYQEQGVKRAVKQLTKCEFLRPDCAQVSTCDELFDARDSLIVSWEHHYILRFLQTREWRILMAIADDEINAWAARGTPLG